MTKMTLEQIIKSEKKTRREEGMFGMNACKEEIMWDVKYSSKSLYVLLEEYVTRANEDMFFNKGMVLACWELINKQ